MVRKVNDGRVRLSQESIYDQPNTYAKTDGCSGCLLQIVLAIAVVVAIFLFLWSKK